MLVGAVRRSFHHNYPKNPKFTRLASYLSALEVCARLSVRGKGVWHHPKHEMVGRILRIGAAQQIVGNGANCVHGEGFCRPTILRIY